MGPGIADGFNEVGRLEPENLIAGEFPRVSKFVTITGTGTLPEGAVLGEITAADDLYQLSVLTATDGSQTPNAILAEPVDFTLGDVVARVYLTGEFNQEIMILGGGHTVASVRRMLRQRSIFLKGNQAA